MNETELINRFSDINSKILVTKSKLKYAIDKSSLQQELYLLEKDLEYTISSLKSIEDKTITSKKLEIVKSVLLKLYTKFSKKDYPYKFSRDQGLIIRSFILLKIVEDIVNAFDHEKTVISDYYLEVGSDFDCSEINRILKEAIEYLRQHKPNDYIELYSYIKSIQKQIISIDKDCGIMTI